MKSRLLLSCSLSIAFILSGTLVSVGQSLTVSNGLQLWLKAEAGVTTNAAGGVTLWADQSGQGNNAVQIDDAQAPALVNAALNGLPVLRFDGTNDFLDVADSASLSFTGDISSFFVVKFDNFATFRAVWGKTAGPNGNLPAPTDIYALPNDGRLRVFRGDGAAVNSSATSDRPLPANIYLGLGFTVEGATLTQFLNAQTNGTATMTTNTADADTALKIGTRSDLFTKMRGDMAELLIYDRALSVSERSNVLSYFQTKYNLNLPPTVSLAGTPAGTNVNVGDIITLTATASDGDGTIARVEFFANGGLLGTASAPPYSLRTTIDSVGTVQFTAVAVDNGGAVATSTPVIYRASATGPTALSVTNGLQLWLKADAGTVLGANDAVTLWADQSGNTNDALQGVESMAPILANNAINGLPALTFDGADDFLEAADSDSLSITGAITSFYVVRIADYVNYNAVWGKTAGPGGNLPAPTDIYTLPNSGTARIYRGDGTGTSLGFVDSARPYPAGSFILAGFDATGTTLSHYLNGLPNGSGALSVGTGDADTPLKIGSRHDLFTKFKGEIAEVVIYDRALPAAERRSLERYLTEKYGLPPLVGLTNALPSIAITSPVGQVLQAPSNVTVTASVSDPDGSVAAVEFFADGVLLGSDSSAPYTANLNLLYGGIVTLTAVVTDNLGGRRTSEAVRVCTQGPGSPAGLVGYWPLNGNGNATVGASGVLVSASPGVDAVPAPDRNGVTNAALAFDGSQSQRVEVPGGGGLNNARQGSISMWVKWTGTQDGGFGGSFGAVLGRQANGVFSDNIIHLNGSDPAAASVQWRQNSAGPPLITGTSLVGEDTWRHIAITFTETNSELFVDSISEGTGTGGVLHNNANIPLAIGAWVGDGASYATATIDDVAVWNRVLSADEVAELAAETRTPLNLRFAPDCITIDRSGANLVVRWGSGAVLQCASNVTGPYADVTTATSPYNAPRTNAASFYRLRSP